MESASPSMGYAPGSTEVFRPTLQLGSLLRRSGNEEHITWRPTVADDLQKSGFAQR
jgi:hypothetical protein